MSRRFRWEMPDAATVPKILAAYNAGVLTLKDIAAKFGISVRTVRRYAERAGCPGRYPKREQQRAEQCRSTADRSPVYSLQARGSR